MISQAALGRWSEMQGDSGMAFSQWISNKYLNTPAVFRNEQTTNYKLYYIIYSAFCLESAKTTFV